MAEPAEQFGRYQLVEKLGEGGMAVVYRALLHGAEGFERQVVLKRILPELSRDPRFTDMLLAEAKLCARMHHPGIVQVNDVGEIDGQYFVAMELVDGFDLAMLLKRCYDLGRPMPPGLAAWIGAELGRALGYAHALTGDDKRPLDVVHRDVSPSNIMVTTTGAVKLLDFGIAKMKHQIADERTRTGTLKGKIGYMSPEQADGESIDRRSDLFSLGIVLWEALTLERLFRGSDDFETLRRVREAKVAPPSSLKPEVPPELDAVLGKLLSRAKEDRYPTGEEVAAALSPIAHRFNADAAALQAFVAELGPLEGERLHNVALDVTTPAKKASARTDPFAPREPSEPVPLEVVPPAAPRNWRRPLAMALGAGVILGVAAWLVARPGRTVIEETPAHLTATPAPSVAQAPVEVAPSPLPARSTPLRLAVLQFKNLGGDHDLEVLTEGIGDTIASTLGSLRGRLTLVERTQIEEALKEIDFGKTEYADKKTAATVGRVTGAEMVLIGGYQRADGRIRVSARLVGSESGEVIDSFVLTRGSGPLFEVQDAVAATLRRRLDALLSLSK
jgi:TolB-like protein/tRNA A-37 threonylcarbamoyl transferase component Bud32